AHSKKFKTTHRAQLSLYSLAHQTPERLSRQLERAHLIISLKENSTLSFWRRQSSMLSKEGRALNRSSLPMNSIASCRKPPMILYGTGMWKLTACTETKMLQAHCMALEYKNRLLGLKIG